MSHGGWRPVLVFVTVWMKTEGVLVLGTSVVRRGQASFGR
jgi:hypothetical protein